jgi:hypothetical protein
MKNDQETKLNELTEAELDQICGGALASALSFQNLVSSRATVANRILIQKLAPLTCGSYNVG